MTEAGVEEKVVARLLRRRPRLSLGLGWRAGALSFSSTVTRVPGAARVSAYAADRPTIPPPITSTSQSYAAFVIITPPPTPIVP